MYRQSVPRIPLEKKMDIDKFDWSLRKMFLFVGESNTGKNFIAREIIAKYYDQFFTIYVFSGTAGVNDGYDFCQPQNIYQVGEYWRIDFIIRKQQILIEASKKNPNVKVPLILIVLDDFVGHLQMNMGKDSAVFRTLATSGRWYNIVTMVISQNMSSIPPCLRMNAQYFLVTKVSHREIENYLYQYQYYYKRPNDLCEAYTRNVTAPYYSMMIDRENSYGNNVIFFNPCAKVEFSEEAPEEEVVEYEETVMPKMEEN
jgi:hypothetical protein